MSPYRWQGVGRKRDDRLAILEAFVAKAVYNFPTTKMLIAYLHDSKNLRRLCGWESKEEIPSESTFSRAFEKFSCDGLGQKIHEAMVKQHAGPKLVGHVSRDATEIDAREKPLRKELKSPQSKPKRKRGRPRQGEAKVAKEPKRLDLQLRRSLAENMADLPTRCDVGTQMNTLGNPPRRLQIELLIHYVAVLYLLQVVFLLVSSLLFLASGYIPGVLPVLCNRTGVPPSTSPLTSLRNFPSPYPRFVHQPRVLTS
jgi:hypothetical protein